MRYAICPLSIVPVRTGMNDRSEQLTQLLFGDLVEILETKGKVWTKIRAEWDNSIGWVLSNQLQAVTPSEFELFRKEFAFSLDLLCPVMNEQSSIPVPFGARLPGFDGIRLQVADKVFTFSGQGVFPKSIQKTPDILVKLARRLLFAPFQPGGLSPLGIDAGGLTQLLFRVLGYKLDRDPAEQVYQGEPIDFMEQARPGDLAFFENKKGKIHHAGILLEKDQIIHAYGRVRIDQIDHYGIFDPETKNYSHQLRVLRRIPIFTETPLTPVKAQEQVISNQFELF